MSGHLSVDKTYFLNKKVENGHFGDPFVSFTCESLGELLPLKISWLPLAPSSSPYLNCMSYALSLLINEVFPLFLSCLLCACVKGVRSLACLCGEARFA